jgi:NitT/TauT family transport system ATP-binding protein
MPTAPESSPAPSPGRGRPGWGTPIIDIQGVTKLYTAADGSEFHALGPLDLAIQAGEFVSIVGPSGCGKSTLLRILSGLDMATAGHILLHQKPGDERPFNSMVFQGDSTFPWLTVHGNVEYGMRVRGIGLRERDQTVARMLQVVGLSGFAEAYPYQLSGGMRQRVALARALANDPHVLLMDEPFGALDAQNRTLLQDELLQIWEQDAQGHPGSGREANGPDERQADEPAQRKTILFVTHSIDEAIILSDRVLVMSAAPGRLIAEVQVPFTRPRQSYELIRTPQFGELNYQIWEALRDEVNAARALERR